MATGREAKVMSKVTSKAVSKAISKKSTKGKNSLPPSRLSDSVDPAARTANIVQLRRARGQIDGIERMIDDDRYCVDIITQITAARASLQVVAKALLEAHLKAAHKASMNDGGAAADAMYQELIGLVSKMAK